jgi:hypothetical protein
LNFTAMRGRDMRRLQGLNPPRKLSVFVMPEGMTHKPCDLSRGMFFCIGSGLLFVAVNREGLARALELVAQMLGRLRRAGLLLRSFLLMPQNSKLRRAALRTLGVKIYAPGAKHGVPGPTGVSRNNFSCA